MTGDSGTTSRSKVSGFERIIELRGLYRWLFHSIPNVVCSHFEFSKIGRENKESQMSIQLYEYRLPYECPFELIVKVIEVAVSSPSF
jgi:hypothetical protein